MAGVAVVLLACGFVGTATTHEVWCHHAMAGGHENGDEVPVQERPRGFAMHEQHGRRIARAFIDVRNAQATHFRVVRRIGEVGQGREAFLGCAEDALW